jgi:RHS repeat-associated protein
LIYKKYGSSSARIFNLPDGVNERTYAVKLKVRDDEYQYGYETVYVTVKRPKHFYFYVKDHLGSTRAVVDEAGDVVEAYDYYPFGLQSRSYKEKGDPLTKETFTGKEQDTESNLHYFGARYYDAGAGRWLSVDPLAGKYLFLSPYVAMNNNLLRYIDPNGMEWYQVTEEYEEEETDEDGNTSIVKKTRKVWKYFADTPEKEIWTGEYNSDGSKRMILTQGIIELLFFDGSNLSWLHADGSTQSWAAVSGILDALGNTRSGLQASEDQGPIPEGWYLVDPSQTLAARNASSFFDLALWVLKSYDWGMFATPIFAMDGTDNYAYGRNSSFIHGGKEPGSIGCIDLTKNNYYFHKKFMNHGKVMPMNVTY